MKYLAPEAQPFRFVRGQLRGTLEVDESLRRQRLGPLRQRLGQQFRRPGRVEANPASLDCRRYLTGCRRGRPDEANPGFGFIPLYQWGDKLTVQWEQAAPEASPVREETASLTLVAFTPRGTPAGHLHLQFVLGLEPSRRLAVFTILPHIVFVRPTRRGEGYSTDLVLAGEMLVKALSRCVMGQVPAGWRFRFAGHAQCLSKGGHDMVNAMFEAAESVRRGRSPERQRVRCLASKFVTT